MSRAGSVKRDESGKWRFVVDITPPGATKRKQAKKRGFATRKAAQAALDEIKAQIREGGYVAPSKQTVAEFLDEWLITVRPTIRPATHYSYARNVRLHVVPRIGDVRLQSLDGGMLNRLFAELLEPGVNHTRPDEGLSTRSVSYIATILKRALRDAVRWGRIIRNPADAADPPKLSAGKRRQMVTWTAEQLREFLTRSVAENDTDNALWRLLASTGMRRGEALGLRWSDLDLKAGTATIRQTVVIVGHEIVIGTPKTAAGLRTIELDDVTVTVLKAHRKQQLAARLAIAAGWKDHDLVFPAVDGSPTHPEAVSKRFDRRAARYGLPHIGVHGLRHTWATLALRAGVHPKVVQERLGHASITITLTIYSHVTEGLGRDAAEQVAALFSESL